MSRVHAATTLILGLLVASAGLGQRPQASRREAREVERASLVVTGLKRELREARRLLVDVTDRKLREQLELALSRAALQAEELEELLAGSPRPPARMPIAEQDFARLLRSIKQQSFDDQKVEFIETFVKGRPLSCEQASEILKSLSFDDGRIRAAVMLHPGLVDPENFFEVLKVFAFESTRKEVMDALRKQ